METTKTKSLITKNVQYSVKILAPSTTKHYQRKKILFKQIKSEANKRFKKYNVKRILVEPTFNLSIQKYGKFKLPKYFNISATIIYDQINILVLDCKKWR